MTTKSDQTKTSAARNTRVGHFSGLTNDSCPDVKAIYLFIVKAFCISSVLSWFFIACPAAVAAESSTPAFAASAVSHANNLIGPNFGATVPGALQSEFAWRQQNNVEFQSADSLHEGVKRLRQALSNWWASKPQHSAITTQVKSVLAASGDGPYAAWSYNIGASSKALEINIRYEF